MAAESMIHTLEEGRRPQFPVDFFEALGDPFPDRFLRSVTIDLDRYSNPYVLIRIVPSEAGEPPRRVPKIYAFELAGS
jgi:hypothetical protein